MKKSIVLLMLSALALSAMALVSCATAAATADALGAAAVKSVASNGSGGGKDSTVQQVTQTQNVTVNVNTYPQQQAQQGQAPQQQTPQYSMKQPGCNGNEEEVTIEYCQEKTGLPCFQGIGESFRMATAKDFSERNVNASIATATSDNITSDLDEIRKQLAEKGVIISENDSLSSMVKSVSKAAISGATIFKQGCFYVPNGSNANEYVFRYITVKRLPEPVPEGSKKSAVGTAVEWVSAKIIDGLKGKKK